ncbi:hypothetical protein ATK36_2660 [Amycolatopsis sulphurea]|uniref:Ribbon-helix-helix CopG family protein n=1 Tax=Amycolatopsis sulphurea TaxID=76022 RepID=A0A2A9F9I4_9PSEU|nr:CopG family transcriptional regulator [Amycolatopsis sulphurea]PFG47613.1 hypothetical protein ATK36_2660 [Amycolatopsis sulphurea]
MAMTLRLSEEQEHALGMLAEVNGVSKHEAVVRAITDAAARQVRDDRVHSLSVAGRSRYAGLLDRLAQ